MHGAWSGTCTRSCARCGSPRRSGSGASSSSPPSATSPTTGARSSSCSRTCWAPRCRPSPSTTRRTRTRPRRPSSGPFFVDDAPRDPARRRHRRRGGRAAVLGRGHGQRHDGSPVAGARIEVWEADEDGFYDVQYDDDRTAGRGHWSAPRTGRYRFWAVTPDAVPDPARRPGRRDARGRGPLADARLAPALHGRGARLPHPGDPHLRRRRRACSSGHRLRRQGVPGQGLRRATRRHADPRRPGRRRASTWSRTRFDIVLAPAD